MKKIIVLSVLLCSITFADDAPKLDTLPKSPEAIAAIKKADNELLDAAAAYQTTVTKVRQTEQQELKKAESDAMKTADLDEANKIQSQITKIEQTQAVAPQTETQLKVAELGSRLAGTTWSNVSDGGVIFTLNKDGTVNRTDGNTGMWAVIGQTHVIIFSNNNYFDLWDLSDDLSKIKVRNARVSGDWKGKRIN